MAILVSCIIGGLVFAVIAYFTALRASTALAKAGDPTRIQINNVLSISTGNAVVALFILAVVIAVGVPSLYMYFDKSQRDGKIDLEMRLDPAVENLEISSLDSFSGHIAKVDVFRSRIPQHFKITTTPEYSSVDVDAYYDWLNHQLMVTVDGQTVAVAVEDIAAKLPLPITLKKALISGVQSAISVKLSKPAGISEAALALADPKAVSHQ